MIDSDYETEQAIERCIGHKIENVKLYRDKYDECDVLSLRFDHGILDIYDKPICCEKRYISIEKDDIEKLNGRTFTGIRIASINYKPRDYENGNGDEHEIAFVEIHTDSGPITFRAHNIHNGYYSGFDIVCRFYGHEATRTRNR